jgi:ATP-dependent DNA ligase
MVDQLSLRLEPVLPRLPAELRPMLPRPAAGPFDSVEHLFEPNWGGRRALAFLEPNERRARRLRLLDEDGRDLAPLLPELDQLASRISRSSGVLDGELVVVDRHGRADHGALQTRLGGSGVTIGRPVAYLAFDLLYLDGMPLLSTALEKRRRLLAEVLVPGEEIVAVPAIAGEGRALHDAVVLQGIAGVMARERRSPYFPGVRSGLWLFVGAAERSPAGEPATHDLPDTDKATQPDDARPVLALIRRLPIDFSI